MAEQGDVYMYNPDTPVALKQLKETSQTIQCPFCHENCKTRITKEGVSYQGWLNFCCWPLPNRKHWFEYTNWSCAKCNKQVARQKYGGPLQIMSESLKTTQKASH